MTQCLVILSCSFLLSEVHVNICSGHFLDRHMAHTEENHIEGSEDAELGLEPVGFQGIQRHPRVDGKWILGPRGLG